MVDELLISTHDGVGKITLNRPRTINALTPAMIDDLLEALSAWAQSADVHAVELHGAGERGFCAGADIRQLAALVSDGGDWIRFFEQEYAMNALIGAYPKPITAHMRGVTMGGGLGLTGHAPRRIVYANTLCAMPETKIGFFPDVGILYQLSRAGAVGVHIALASATFTGGDAIRIGLADESADGELPAPLFEDDKAWIAECYAGEDVVEVVRRLESHPHPEANKAAADIRARSPLGVHVALRALRNAATMTLPEVLAQDLALVRTLLPVDFPEGVRALLVDKDNAPKWRHARLEDVTPAEVDALFP
ncbi:MAG: enoyl-CoA hydratase/isomerase family protein [Tessaracoccus sp.]